jgi:hypothetical protein
LIGPLRAGKNTALIGGIGTFEEFAFGDSGLRDGVRMRRVVIRGEERAANEHEDDKNTAEDE